MVGCRGTRGRWHLCFGESGSLRGRKLFNGAYMSNIARRKSRTERRRREVVAAAVAVAVDIDVGSCCCCWKLREIFVLFNLIRIPTFYWRLWRRRCSNITKNMFSPKYLSRGSGSQGVWQTLPRALGGWAKVE